MLTNSSPSLRVLGTLNGVAVAVAALGRAAGPAVNYSYLNSFVLLLITCRSVACFSAKAKRVDICCSRG
jgi:hypothetical protein